MIIQEWFEQLAPRERIMVSACGIVIVIALLWIAVIQPIFAGSARLEARVEEKQAQLANLQELASQVSPGQPSQRRTVQGRNESIVVIIDRTTRNRQLAPYLKRNQPEGDSAVRLRLEGAPFDALVEWIGELQQTYGMTAVTANMDLAGSGRVNCTLLLSRATG
ncbi:MAG: type II secretion system protein M [Gammaproteobacteria bacterium]|nr:type II secretion system protein M [Gammaproteobacteria bacterium]